MQMAGSKPKGLSLVSLIGRRILLVVGAVLVWLFVWPVLKVWDFIERRRGSGGGDF